MYYILRSLSLWTVWFVIDINNTAHVTYFEISAPSKMWFVYDKRLDSFHVRRTFLVNVLKRPGTATIYGEILNVTINLQASPNIW